MKTPFKCIEKPPTKKDYDNNEYFRKFIRMLRNSSDPAPRLLKPKPPEDAEEFMCFQNCINYLIENQSDDPDIAIIFGFQLFIQEGSQNNMKAVTHFVIRRGVNFKNEYVDVTPLEDEDDGSVFFVPSSKLTNSHLPCDPANCTGFIDQLLVSKAYYMWAGSIHAPCCDQFYAEAQNAVQLCQFLQAQKEEDSNARLLGVLSGIHPFSIEEMSMRYWLQFAEMNSVNRWLVPISGYSGGEAPKPADETLLLKLSLIAA